MAALLSSSPPLTQLHMNAHMRSTQTCVHSHTRTRTLTQCPDFFLFPFFSLFDLWERPKPCRVSPNEAESKNKTPGNRWLPASGLKQGRQACRSLPRSVPAPSFPGLLMSWRPHISLASSSVSVERSPFTILLFSSCPGGAKANV